MRQAAVLVLLLLAFLGLASDGRAREASGERRLLSLGITKDAAVPDDILRTLEDTFTAQLDRAAHERAFEMVPLSRVSGLAEQAEACRDRRCRLEVSGRLKTTHLVRGYVEREGRGYRLTLLLEDGRSGDFLAGKRMRGAVPRLVGELQEKVDELLEEASPKRVVAMKRLAETARAYLEKGREDDALRTLQRAIDVSPYHPEGAALQIERVALLEKKGDEDATFAAVLEVLESYGPRSLWTLAGIGEDGAQRRLHQWLRTKLAAIATHNQREAQRLDAATGPDEATAAERARRVERAERAYTAYLDAFPDASDVPELTLYLAELEYGRGAYVDAAAHYALVREAPSAAKALRQQAASSAVYALEKELEAAIARGDLDAVDLAQPLAPLQNAAGLSYEERAFIAAIDGLTKAFPAADDADAFAYRAAQLCVFRGELDEGKARLSEVAKTWPTSRAGRLATAALKGL